MGLCAASRSTFRHSRRASLFAELPANAARRRGRSEAVRASLLVHAGLAALPVALALGGVVSWGVALAFAPVVIRAAVGAWRLTPALRIKRLGWTELAHSLVFALLLVIGLRA